MKVSSVVKNKFLFCFSIVFLLSSAQAHSSNSYVAKHDKAHNALEQKRYDVAFDLYKDILQEYGNSKETNLGIAISAFNLKKYSSSILAYERLIKEYPDSFDYYNQISYVYRHMGNENNAKYYYSLYERKKYELKQKQIANMNNKKLLIEKTKERKSFSSNGNISAGLIYDSNANRGPNSNILNVGILDNLVFSNLKGQSSFGAYGSFDLNGYYLPASNGNLSLVGSISGYERWNFSSKVSSNNKQSWGKLSLGSIYEKNRLYTDVRFKGEIVYADHKESEDETVYAIGPEASLIYVISDNLQIMTKGIYEYQLYNKSDYNDGSYWSVGQYLYKSLYNDKYGIYLGASVIGSDVDDKNLSYNGWEATIRMFYKISDSLTLSPSYVYKQQMYNGGATALDIKDRSDKQSKVGLSLSWGFLPNWNFDASYQFIDNHSNSEIYRYDDNVAMTSVTFRF